MVEQPDWEGECRTLHKLIHKHQKEAATAQAETKLLSAEVEEAKAKCHDARAKHLAAEAEMIALRAEVEQLRQLLGDVERAKQFALHFYGWQELLGQMMGVTPVDASTSAEN